MTAAEIKQILNLQPHPREGGWYTRTWESGELLAPSAFPDRRYPTPRHTSTAIYYLLEPGTFSEMHLLASDELFHHYLGDPVQMLQLAPNHPGRTVLLGPDLRAGQRPQVAVPRGTWQGSRLLPGGSFALLGCTVAPGFEYEDYRAPDPEALSTTWPDFANLIHQLTR